MPLDNPGITAQGGWLDELVYRRYGEAQERLGRSLYLMRNRGKWTLEEQAEARRLAFAGVCPPPRQGDATRARARAESEVPGRDTESQ
jgi:hypothetical protein